VGPLDEGLATAFDFDLWLRIFQRFPGRIGYLERVQASSRLHAGCITMKQRRLVAAEGVRLQAKYLGRAQDHWVRTHVEELLADYPFGGVEGDLVEHIAEFVTELAGCFDPTALCQLRADLAADARLQLTLPGVAVTVYSDGWAPRLLSVRVASLSPYISSMWVQCLHDMPGDAPLELSLSASWGWKSRIRIETRGPFQMVIPFSGVPTGGNVTVQIAADRVHLPGTSSGGGADGRALAYRVLRLQMR
jgi:hypothetical protein